MENLCISLHSRFFFTHRAIVATYAKCFGIGTRIHFAQLPGDCVSGNVSPSTCCFQLRQPSCNTCRKTFWTSLLTAEIGLHPKIANVISNELEHMLARIGRAVRNTLRFLGFSPVYARQSSEKIRYYEKFNVNPRPAGGAETPPPPLYVS